MIEVVLKPFEVLVFYAIVLELFQKDRMIYGAKCVRFLSQLAKLPYNDIMIT